MEKRLNQHLPLPPSYSPVFLNKYLNYIYFYGNVGDLYNYGVYTTNNPHATIQPSIGQIEKLVGHRMDTMAQFGHGWMHIHVQRERSTNLWLRWLKCVMGLINTRKRDSR